MICNMGSWYVHSFGFTYTDAHTSVHKPQVPEVQNAVHIMIIHTKEELTSTTTKKERTTIVWVGGSQRLHVKEEEPDPRGHASHQVSFSTT